MEKIKLAFQMSGVLILLAAYLRMLMENEKYVNVKNRGSIGGRGVRRSYAGKKQFCQKK